MTDDVLQTAQWLVSGRLAPYAVDEKSVVAMAKKLLEALEALEASQDALNETLAFEDLPIWRRAPRPLGPPER